MARYEKFFANKDDRNGKKQEEATGGLIPARFGFQHDTVLGMTYTLMPNLEVQMEYHWYQGAARLTPVVVPNAELNDEEYWEMWAVQLMYWF